MMNAWLASPKKTSATAEAEEEVPVSYAMDETKLEEVLEEPQRATRSRKRNSRSPTKPKKASPLKRSEESSSSVMEGIEETGSAPKREDSDEDELWNLEAKLDDVLESAHRVPSARAGARTRSQAAYQAPKPIDEATAAYVPIDTVLLFRMSSEIHPPSAPC
jgi:hypothetical protein